MNAGDYRGFYLMGEQASSPFLDPEIRGPRIGSDEVGLLATDDEHERCYASIVTLDSDIRMLSLE